jgi:hypothetical protein
MHEMEGMLVTLETDTGKYSGTDDHIYVGVFGKEGGSEFPLDVHGFNDFEPGTVVKYWFGDVWEDGVLAGAKRPYEADGWNNPEKRSINLEKVDYVYLRKHSHKGGSDDDAWKMEYVEVVLYGNIKPQPKKRTFRKTGDIWLGNEYGLQVWLKEK